MIGDFLDIILGLVSVVVVIYFFILCSNVSAIRKFFTESGTSQDNKINELKSELERVNRALASIERNTKKTD